MAERERKLEIEVCPYCGQEKYYVRIGSEKRIVAYCKCFSRLKQIEKNFKRRLLCR